MVLWHVTNVVGGNSGGVQSIALTCGESFGPSAKKCGVNAPAY